MKVFLLLFWVQLGWATQLPSEQIKDLRHSIVEVVIPKFETEGYTYERELPFHKLSFQRRNDDYFSIGTAFFISPNQLVSAAHVFGLSNYSINSDFFIRDVKGRVHKVTEILRYSEYADLIEFKTATLPKKVIPLKSQTAVEIGDTVYSMGNALGEGISFRAGQVASFTPESYEGKWNYIRFSSPASPGNSGGPLLNQKGEFLGVIVKKNFNENLNFAVPTSELNKLDKKTAKLFFPDLVMSDADAPQAHMTKTYSETISLPQRLEELAKEAQKKLHTFYTDMLKEFEKKFADVLFPKSPHLVPYLRNPSYVNGFALLQSYSHGRDWRTDSHGSQSIQLSAERSIRVAKNGIANLQFFVDKPENMALKQFVDSPVSIFNAFLKAWPNYRWVAGDKIRITAVGSPIETKVWTDRKGRTWRSSRWNQPGADNFFYLHCLPVPNGVGCLYDNQRNSKLSLNYFALKEYDINQLVVGYSGTVEHWKEYLKLGKRYLPKSMVKIKIDREDTDLSVTSDDFNFTVPVKGLNEKSEVKLFFGIHSTARMDEELLAMQIYPVPGDSNNTFWVEKYYEPMELNSDTNQFRWKQALNGEGAYKNSTFTEHGLKKRYKASKMASENTAAFTRLLVTGCWRRTLNDDGSFDEDCEKFIDGFLRD